MIKNFVYGKYTVKKSIVIEKSATVVFQKVLDLKSWNDWSPWLLHEPDASVEYSKDVKKEGGYYTWSGKIIGAGKITHVKIIKNKTIEQKIEFFKPFRSVSKILWEFDEEKGGIKTSWSMEGKMPFLFRFMIPKMTVEIGKDYELGLAMLNGKINPKAQYPRISFMQDPVSLKAKKYLIKSYRGNLKNLQNVAGSSFSKLMDFVQKNNYEGDGYATTLYHKINPKTDDVVCDFAIPIVAEKENKGDFSIKSLPQQKYIQTNLKGNYHFLEMAWSKSYTNLMMTKQKINWRSPSLEIYATDPRETKNPNDYLTELYIPIK